MDLYYSIVFFLFGTIFGSFFHVVGSRLSQEKSIIKPRSHCDNCGHVLTPFELIPVISYLLLRGKCSSCKQKVSIIHPLYEILCGLMFALCYYLFGFSYELILALIFVSMALIILISDIGYFIIPDEVLLVAGILIAFTIFIGQGWLSCLIAIGHGLLSFGVMYLIKLGGDFLFQKESMGGGDIKLMFVFGLTFGFPMAIVSIFLAALIGLPISLFIVLLKKDHVVPFGPFLGSAGVLILLFSININQILDWLKGV